MLPEFRIATHPGQILLAEFLEPLRLTQAELARSLRIPLNRVNELVRGKRGITPESALLLSEYFRNSPEFWMNLQTAHDLSRTRQEMRKRPGGISTALVRAHRDFRLIRCARHRLAIQQQTSSRVHGQTSRAGSRHRLDRLHSNHRNVEAHVLRRLRDLHNRKRPAQRRRLIVR